MAVDITSPNMTLWRAVEKTDPAFVKAITGKQYRGSSPNPHWIKMRLTEQFGPAGKGWGTRILDQQFITIGDQMMHYVTIELWWMDGERRCSIEECGGTQLGGKRKSGDAFADEDAPKKSVTDALVKAASALGFCADIFLGRWDDNKYVEQREQEEAAAKQAVEKKADAVGKAEVARKVQLLCDSLANITTQEALLNCRAEALELHPKLKEFGLRDEHQTLGAAMKDATARLQPQQAAA